MSQIMRIGNIIPRVIAENSAEKTNRCPAVVLSNRDDYKRLFAKIANEVCHGYVFRKDYASLYNDILDWCLMKPGKYNPNKGLFLWGDIGTGKTTLLEIVRRFCNMVRPRDKENNSYSFYTIHATELCSKYQANGYDGLSQFIASRRLAIDELGNETIPTNYYGTPENVMQHVLLMRYDRRYGSFTHVTTNYMPEQLPALYGERVYDRCREMFNFVEMRGASFRK